MGTHKYRLQFEPVPLILFTSPATVAKSAHVDTHYMYNVNFAFRFMEESKKKEARI